jgi:rubredoxin
LRKKSSCSFCWWIGSAADGLQRSGIFPILSR